MAKSAESLMELKGDVVMFLVDGKKIARLPWGWTGKCCWITAGMGGM